MKETWINHTNGRYYKAYICKDLFGVWTLTLTWGGRMRKGGAIKHLPFDSIKKCLAAISEIGNKRLLRGYEKCGV